MKKTIAIAVCVAAVSTSQAFAGGWGSGSSYSSGLINVSPSVNLGDVNALNGIRNNSAIASGNNVLSGNVTGILNQSTGILSGIGVNLLSGSKKKR